ncbi:trp-like ion channel pkd2 [Gigaspora margarita]|uniref:Trp-like ion channel pkd2 n=1 Tax=Gigaspora margarita TaxID=4874 RepID=A0A8H4EU30_GIGMA|nr:trp-like ion channel pkd2 [Gigaspora margarita]
MCFHLYHKLDNISYSYIAPLATGYNAPIVIGISFVALSYVISKTGIVKSGSIDNNLPVAHAHGLSTSKSSHNHDLSTDDAEKSCGCCAKIFNIKFAPSVYDIFRAAQFFITTALIPISNLSDFYRELASKFSWLSALPSSFNLTSLASVADNNIRIAICQMFDPCKTTTNVTSCNLDSHSEIYKYAQKLKVPSYDLFFLVFMVFLFASALVICITLLIWLIARFGVCLHDKWKILETVAANCLFFYIW